MKRCTSCRRLLEIDEFPMDRGKRYPRCLACKRAQVARNTERKRHAAKLAAWRGVVQ